MPKMIENRKGWSFTAFPRPGNKWVIAAGWIVFAFSFLIITMFSVQPVSAPSSQFQLDKILHALAYASLTFGMIFAWPKRSLVLIFTGAFVLGALLEIYQGTLGVGRTASIYDALANGVGSALVIGLWVFICPRLTHNLA